MGKWDDTYMYWLKAKKNWQRNEFKLLYFNLLRMLSHPINAGLVFGLFIYGFWVSYEVMGMIFPSLHITRLQYGVTIFFFWQVGKRVFQK